MAHEGGVAIGILRVGADVEREGGRQVELRGTHQARQVLVRVCRSDRLQARLRRRQAGVLDGIGVDEAAIEVADLLLRTAVGGVCRNRLDDLPQIRARTLIQLSEDTPARAIGGNGVGVEPMAVGVPIEVVAGLHRLVVGAQVQAESPELRLALGDLGRRRGLETDHERSRAREASKRSSDHDRPTSFCLKFAERLRRTQSILRSGRGLQPASRRPAREERQT